MKMFSHTRLAKHTSNYMEPSNPFHTLGQPVDAEVITDEKNRTPDLPLEINEVTSKLKSQMSSSETLK